MDVVPDGTPLIVLKSGHMERAATSSLLGADKLWSSSTFYQHLGMLKGLVPPAVSILYHMMCGVLKFCQNEASAHTWIDAFFFRVSAMVQHDQCMVLNQEQPVPQTIVQPSTSTAFSGFIDYTAIIASEFHARELIILHWDQLELID